MTLTAKDVAEITRLMEESSFDELTLELEGLKLTLRCSGAVTPAASEQAEPPAALSGAGSASEPAPAPVAPAPSGQADAATRTVTAPLLGTFYRAPKPGAPPFVEIGSVVEEDTIIGIIEVMKLMNTVRAGTRGRVLDILAQDGTLVEYGQTLLCVGKADPE